MTGPAMCALRQQDVSPADWSGAKRREDSQSFISKLYNSISRGIPFAEPVSSLQTNEFDLVSGVLQMLQGFPSSLFIWDEYRQSFVVRSGTFVSHLSQSGLGCILNQFVYAASCLKLVELFVKKVETLKAGFPTLKAFSNSVSLWLKKLRNIALSEEVKRSASDSRRSATLLGLTNSLSSLCSGAEHLMQVVYGAVPSNFFYVEPSIPAAEVAVLILDYLYKKLNEVSLVQGGEEAYHMLLVIFVGSLLPYLKGLDSWLYDGMLDDPYEEMFFYANNAVAVNQPAFWEKSYLLRLWSSRSSSDTFPSPCNGNSTTKDKGGNGHNEFVLRGKGHNDLDIVVCPMFLKDIAKAIISAGKSLKLVQYVHNEFNVIFGKGSKCKASDIVRESFCSQCPVSDCIDHAAKGPECTSLDSETGSVAGDHFGDDPVAYLQRMFNAQDVGFLTLSEIFLVSLVGLVADGNHIFEDLTTVYQSLPEISKECELYVQKQKLEKEHANNVPLPSNFEKLWFRFLLDAIIGKNRNLYNQRKVGADCMIKNVNNSVGLKKAIEAVEPCSQAIDNICCIDEAIFLQSFYPENPGITVCKEFLNEKSAFWDELNISGNFHLPSLNDETLQEAIFCGHFSDADVSSSKASEAAYSRFRGTDYTFGFRFSEFECLRLAEDAKDLESLFPFPSVLPYVKEDLSVSELLPFQENSTLASRILSWIQNANLKTEPFPTVIVQNCLHVFISKQVDCIGKHILLKLMNDWRLMEELRVLRAIYLLGSGDILQQFLMVIFGKLDKGDSWDDDFELNTILQDSVRNSADGVILKAPDSLTVSITKDDLSNKDEHATTLVSTPRKVQNQRIRVNDLDLLDFKYKVSWPLDLIINTEAIKKYNQVMLFLLKVKHAKFVLDKARRWMWKRWGAMTHNHKHHLLVEQKLLHFVDAFHQYVMDRVFHSAWMELCHNMASAGSLDKVIEVHEAYLSSVQRQCFVAPDKLWALIANRIKNVLGLALDFYAVQKTLNTGGAAPAIKARCELEVDRIEKQFDDCISFLLRILSFKLNVGQFPHLADLVTRINYNHFYMSDNGNLLTTPSFETTSKLGKTYPGRAD